MSVVLFGIVAFMGAARSLWWRPGEAGFSSWLGALLQTAGVCVAAGLLTEVLYLAVRYRTVEPGRWRCLVGALAADYLFAGLSGLLLYAVLASPIFNEARTGTLAGVSTAVLLAGTLGAGSVFHRRWAPAPDPSRAGIAGAVVTLSGQLVVSLAAAAVAGKIYVLLARPGAAWIF